MATDRYVTTVESVRGHDMTVYVNRHRSLRELFDASVERFASRDHVVFGDRRDTFADVEDRVARIADGLSRLGVTHGDRVAVLGANHPAWFELLWASTRLGAILVGLNGWWAADELAYALDDSSPTVLVADVERLERISSVLDRAGGPAHVLVYGEISEHGPATGRYDDLASGERDGSVHAVDEDDVAVLLYTSGTTGRSKAAMWTHRSILASLQSRAHLVSSKTKTKSETPAAPAPDGAATRVLPSLLVTVPLFHTSGLYAAAITGMAIGAKEVILDGRYRPAAAAELIEREEITAWGAVPTMVVRLLADAEVRRHDLSSLQSISYGGAPAPPDLPERIATELGIDARVGNAYGLTETTSPVFTIEGDDYRDHPDSVGRPHPTVDVRIVDDTGDDVAVGERGEVQVRGAMVMAGYWNRPDATAETFVDGWLRTGDIGDVDADGYLYLRDRARDIIIRGGENVYCAEIEHRLEDHPGVLEAALIGTPHPDLGEEVTAIVHVVDGAAASEGDLRAWVAEVFAPFKVPSTVEIRNEPLPRNATGKLLKPLLREQAAGHSAGRQR